MLRPAGGNDLKFGNFRSTKVRREASPERGYGDHPSSPSSLQSISLSQIQALEMDAGKEVVSSLLAAVQTWPGFG